MKLYEEEKTLKMQINDEEEFSAFCKRLKKNWEILNITKIDDSCEKYNTIITIRKVFNEYF